MRSLGIAAIPALVCLSAAAETPNRLTRAEQAAGWRLLFDGATSRGWEEVTGKPFPANCWSIVDGSLKAMVRGDGFQDIRTTETFGSFDLRFEWRLPARGNSGVKYLIQRVDEWNNQAGRQARARGLEYQLATADSPEAVANPHFLPGSLYGILGPKPNVEAPPDTFNSSRIVVRGDRVEHWLNGVKVVEFDPAAPPVRDRLLSMRPKSSPSGAPILRTGAISLQNHSSEACFRNIRIKPLD